MKEGIFKAVANPPKILWGPFLPVLLNLSVQFPLMFMIVGTFDVNPILFMASVFAGHIAITLIGFREPHVSNMLQAFGQSNKPTNNLYPSKGNKFAP